jgi:class 3 adenylate cyclase/tetratricopeptide (TPR) repeat protein
VLFADLAGSTELSVRIEPEHLRSILADVYDQLSWVSDAYGGTVEKFIGDAVMAVFGVPRVHEDDPERAVRAALVMRSRMAALAEQRRLDLELRIGINTGLVVTGTNPGRDFLVTGEAVNLAARLQQAAEPGEILVGERTFRAVEPVVRTVAPRSLTLKGRSGPVVAYAVEGLAPASIYRRRRRAFGPFVGREHELLLIRSLVERAIEHRRPQLVSVVGEPGIGKSRLVEEVVIELQRTDEPPAVWVGRCMPYGESRPYAPLRDLLVRAAAVSDSDSLDDARSKVRGHLLSVLGDHAEDTIAEVLRLVSSRPDAAPEDDDEPDHLERGSHGWYDFLIAVASRRPTLVVIEDVHWAEPALLELIERVVGGATRVPLAVIAIGRDELLIQHPSWAAHIRNRTTITLEALDDGDMRRLALALASTGDPPADAIVMAGGNPFFLEEILAMAGEDVGAAVPDTVQGVIAARLDLLPGDDKQLLQRASVVGRTFELETLGVLAAGGGPAGRVRALAERDLVSMAGPRTYQFKHALIRDVAYESIPRSERARLHLRLARHLDDEGAGTQSIANHYATAAELGAQEVRTDAVDRLLAAAAEARGVYAYGSAMRQASRALALAAADPERAFAHEAVGDAQWMAERSDDAWGSYRLALEHATAAGLERAVMARLRWKFVDLPTRWGAGKRDDRREDVARELELGLADACSVGDRAREARFLVARALLTWKREDATPETLEKALADARTAQAIGVELDRPAIQSAARDAEGVILIRVGRYADAREAAEGRMRLVPLLGHREEQIDACTMAAWTRVLMGDYAAAVEATDRAAELARDSGGHWTAWPLLQRADAFFWWDRWDEALEAYGRFVGVYRSTGPSRRSTPPSRAIGVAVAVHLLRGERELAEQMEQRADLGSEGWHTVAVSHALVGVGDPAAALDRMPKLRSGTSAMDDANLTPGHHVGAPAQLAVRAEALAMLERWDDLDEVLAQAAALAAVAECPRSAAQIDRARGIAGDEIALQRAAATFERLGCAFEHARCLQLQGHEVRARRAFERLGALPSLERL